MRINSNAMFFGRASLGMKKVTTNVAVATFFFATDTGVIHDITARDQILTEQRISEKLVPMQLALLELKGELPTTVLA